MDSEWIVKFTVQMDCPVVGHNLCYLKEWDFDEFILAIGWFIWVDILCAGPIACLLYRWILLCIDFTVLYYKESYEPYNYGFCISAVIPGPKGLKEKKKKKRVCFKWVI